MSTSDQTTQQKKDGNSNLPKTLLQAKTTSQFITIPQTTIDYVALHQAFKSTGKASYILTKLETHEDGGFHIHILIKLETQQRISFIHNVIMSQDGQIGGLIDYRKPDNLPAVVNYLKKEDTAVEGKPYIEYTTETAKKFVTKDAKDSQLIEALEKAKSGDHVGALQDIKSIAPMDYLKFKNTIVETLKSEAAPPRKKYEAPSFSPADVTLNPKQQEVWDLLQCTPINRRIIWVTGSYGSGKSYLYNYIKANHSHGMYDAGQSASLDNVVYGYDEEGVIAWDLPRTFDFENLGNSMAAVIEKFSDFGQSITSKKYSGKTQKVLGHAVVFSNHLPLEQLKHRNLIHIDLSIETSASLEPECPTRLPPKPPKVECCRQAKPLANIPIPVLHKNDGLNLRKKFLTIVDGTQTPEAFHNGQYQLEEMWHYITKQFPHHPDVVRFKDHYPMGLNPSRLEIIQNKN